MLQLGWGLLGVRTLAAQCDAVVIVDVLSFTTAVDVALSRGAVVFPYRWMDETAAAFAASKQAELAGRRGKARWSLSPAALRTLPAGTRLVLPSLNGATLSLATREVPTFAGCLRNAAAVARAAGRLGARIGVVPAGELVPRAEGFPTPDLRFAIEDLYGAGAILRHLPGPCSPEARLAVEAWEAAEADVRARILDSVSGRELVGRGYVEDVEVATEIDAGDLAPRLVDGAYVPA